ncbi:membrane protein ORF126 [Cyprinid herpesvirus 1]|uniref:Membrane protein ORF126 n=1 Tax=Cyprinid herpesvirus 1 TaxID=317858 RepID=K7PCL4_9VIRU|nr:membrane protein ORF126 [Cyprinid herpesvirus 1]AFJ20410.1 membrane protein ORF126 [Cyprinid herpesvirus 1]
METLYTLLLLFATLHGIGTSSHSPSSFAIMGSDVRPLEAFDSDVVTGLEIKLKCCRAFGLVGANCTDARVTIDGYSGKTISSDMRFCNKDEMFFYVTDSRLRDFYLGKLLKKDLKKWKEAEEDGDDTHAYLFYDRLWLLCMAFIFSAPICICVVATLYYRNIKFNDKQDQPTRKGVRVFGCCGVMELYYVSVEDDDVLLKA